MTERNWRPAAGQRALEARAALLAGIRRFFAERGVLEVDTPLLSRAIGSDPHLHPLAVRPGPDGGREMYLQTSPEFPMKRLLAAGSGPIYQICKAFRADEAGARHNPEFTMLEWYRPDFGLGRLMDEVEALVTAVTGLAGASRISYRALFRRHLDIDPHEAPAAALAEIGRRETGAEFDTDERDAWLDLLFSRLIEPGLKGAVFIYDYPPTQAALARVEEDEHGTPVARRFELVIDSLEIANGYLELTDPQEQRRRFERDREIRRARGLPILPLDEALLDAIAHGLPACSGVALGVDRLLMVMLGASSLEEVLSFPLDRA